MTRDEALKLLKRGGAQAVETWNRLRRKGVPIPNLSGVYLSEPDLSEISLREAITGEADFRGADLSGAKLSRAALNLARFSEVDLSDTDLGHADLNEADLSGADLSIANLTGANLSIANLTRAILGMTNFTGVILCNAILTKADLSNAILFDADFTDANLAEADLSNTNLERARLIRTNLDQALVEKAVVREVQVEELTGLPKRPEVLWLDLEGKTVLTGEDARTFFVLPANVEVYLDRRLSAEERACFQLHEAEVHKRLGDTVYFVGHRHEGQGSVLRFQGPSYAEVYRFLPEFLAPFRMADAIDWKRTLEGLSETQRSEALQRLLRAALPEPWDGRQPLQITAGDHADLQVLTGGMIVNKKTETHQYNIHQEHAIIGAEAFDAHAQAHSTGNVQQLVLSREDGAALTKYFEELKTLVAEVKLQDPEPVETTTGALDEAIAEARLPKPSASAIATAWQKAKGWIEGALGLGVWAAAKAEQVRGLVEKIQGMLPGGGN